jgi:hypothetical protein
MEECHERTNRSEYDTVSKRIQKVGHIYADQARFSKAPPALAVAFGAGELTNIAAGLIFFLPHCASLSLI